MPESLQPLLFVGRSTLDVLYRVDELPEEDTKIYASRLDAAPGGPALNAALTAALLGSSTQLASAVGGGLWAEVVRRKLCETGVGLIDLAAGTSFETPLATVLVNARKATRTAINPPLDQQPLKKLSAVWPAGSQNLPAFALTDGFHLAESIDFLRECTKAGTRLCLDGGSWKPLTEELAPLLDAAICGERFAIPGQPATPESVFSWFATQGVDRVAITRGARSILARDSGRSFEIHIEPVHMADTLGAGDVLHGGFLHHYAAGLGFEEALKRAAKLASLSCRGVGVEAWRKLANQ